MTSQEVHIMLAKNMSKQPCIHFSWVLKCVLGLLTSVPDKFRRLISGPFTKANTIAPEKLTTHPTNFTIPDISLKENLSILKKVTKFLKNIYIQNKICVF